MARWFFQGVSRVLLLSTTLTTPAFGHARFKLDGMFKPRTTDTGLKTAPCGDAARTTAPVTLTPGQKVTVEWEETIDHPGFFRLSFSPADDLGFEANVLLDNIADTQNDGLVPHFYRADVTLPNQTCTACTLQLIQVMTENPLAPSNYYSCSDIQLGAAPPAPAPVGNLTTTPGDKQITLAWQNPADNVAGALVLQDTAPVSAVPVDGQTYTLGAALGTARVQFVGVGSNVTVSGLRNGDAYYFAVFTQSPAGKYSSAQQTQVVLPQAPTNVAPQVVIEARQAGTAKTAIGTTGGAVTITASATDANPGDILSYDWTGSDARIIDSDSAPNTLTFDPRNLSAGTYNINVKATDNGIPPQFATAALALTVTAPASTAPITAPVSEPAKTSPSTPSTTRTTSKREGGGSLDLAWLWLLGAAFIFGLLVAAGKSPHSRD